MAHPYLSKIPTMHYNIRMKRIIVILLSAFFISYLWENLHSVLYLNYQGGTISELVLLRASLAGTLIVLALIYLSYLLGKKYRSIFIFIAGVIVAVLIEKWALGTGRWIYAANMPIIPFLNTGLSPTLQLGITALISNWLVKKTG